MVTNHRSERSRRYANVSADCPDFSIDGQWWAHWPHWLTRLTGSIMRALGHGNPLWVFNRHSNMSPHRRLTALFNSTHSLPFIAPSRIQIDTVLIDHFEHTAWDAWLLLHCDYGDAKKLGFHRWRLFVPFTGEQVKSSKFFDGLIVIVADSDYAIQWQGNASIFYIPITICK